MRAVITHIQPSAYIRRERVLPPGADIKVRVGKLVKANDPIAVTSISTRHFLVDVFNWLGLKSIAEADRLMIRKQGDRLEKRDVLAETGGWFSRVIRTPEPGKVVSTRTGRVLIEAESHDLSISAGMTGMITQVTSDGKIVIEAVGDLIQGVWGNGLVGYGLLTFDPDQVDGELQVSTYTDLKPNAVLVAGYCSSPDELKAAASRQVAGVILGSISSGLKPTAEAQPYPLILLGGFGQFGLDPISKGLLLSRLGLEASLNAEAWDRSTGTRPEVIINQPAVGQPCQQQADFTAGQVVRVHASTNIGRVGVIERLIPGLTILPGGLKAPAAEVLLDNTDKEILPLANLDVIDSPDAFNGRNYIATIG